MQHNNQRDVYLHSTDFTREKDDMVVGGQGTGPNVCDLNYLSNIVNII